MPDQVPVVVVPDPAASSLVIPKAPLLEAASVASALNTAASQDVVDPGTAASQDAALDGANALATVDGLPVDGATAEGRADGEGENAAAQAKKKKSEPRVMVPFTSEELDEVIRQGFTVIEKESQKEEYDNGRLEVWKGMLEDYIVKAASLSDKPFKYTFYVSVQQNTGDAAYMAMGALFQADFDGHTSAHWENDDILVDVTVMAFSVQ